MDAMDGSGASGGRYGNGNNAQRAHETGEYDGPRYTRSGLAAALAGSVGGGLVAVALGTGVWAVVAAQAVGGAAAAFLVGATNRDVAIGVGVGVVVASVVVVNGLVAPGAVATLGWATTWNLTATQLGATNFSLGPVAVIAAYLLGWSRTGVAVVGRLVASEPE